MTFTDNEYESSTWFCYWLFKTLGSTGFLASPIGRLLLLKERGQFKHWLEEQAPQ
jgi:hypothetical protein